MTLMFPPHALESDASVADALTRESKQNVPKPAGAASEMQGPSGGHCASRSRRHPGNSSAAETPEPPLPPLPPLPGPVPEQASDSRPSVTPMQMYAVVRIDSLGTNLVPGLRSRGSTIS